MLPSREQQTHVAIERAANTNKSFNIALRLSYGNGVMIENKSVVLCRQMGKRTFDPTIEIGGRGTY